jgi:adenylate cyclase
MTAHTGDRPLRLEAIRACLEGVIPVGIATLAPDGTPNVTYISQVHYVDSGHVALTYQFFNKTRANLLANPHALLQLIDPVTAQTVRVAIAYERTETSGPIFESMRAKLAGIASHTGMASVFRLGGADICRVDSIVAVPGDCLPPREGPSLLPVLRRAAGCLSREADLAAALDGLMASLERELGMAHGAIFLCAPDGRTLYAIASRGYQDSGIGSEIAMGDGVIGMAAQERTAIRINHMTTDVNYARGVGARMGPRRLEEAIPLPGLDRPGSQLAVPIEDGQGLLGVLFVESVEDMRFSYDHEDALAVIASQLAVALRRSAADARPARRRVPAAPKAAASASPAIDVRHYRANDSVFIGDDYLIKGVAGAIFWILTGAFCEEGRADFTNRELRLNPALKLPMYAENLEARLILLERRLGEKDCGIAIEKTGRGRFRLRVDRPLRRIEMQAEEPGRD